MRSWSLSAACEVLLQDCCSCATAGAGEVIEATRVPCRSGAALHIRLVTSIRPGQGRCLRSALKEGILVVQLPEGSSLMKLHDLITPNHAPSFLDVIPKKKKDCRAFVSSTSSSSRRSGGHRPQGRGGHMLSTWTAGFY